MGDRRKSDEKVYTRTAGLKILFTSRDIGAASYIKLFYGYCLESGSADPILIAQEPAYSYFKNSGLTPLKFSRVDNQTVKALRECDVIVSGHREYGSGIDEYVINNAGSKPCYLVKDSSGTVNRHIQSPDKLLLIEIDMSCKQIKRFGNTCKIPPIKYHDFHYESRYPIKSENKVVFIDQCLWHNPGYRRNVKQLARFLQRHGSSLLIKPHPNTKNHTLLKRLFTRYRIDTKFIRDDGEFTRELISSKFVITVFSTMTFDILYGCRDMTRQNFDLVEYITDPLMQKQYKIKRTDPLRSGPFITAVKNKKDKIKKRENKPYAMHSLKKDMGKGLGEIMKIVLSCNQKKDNIG